MTKFELQKYHHDELDRVQKNLDGWRDNPAPYGDEKCKQDHIDAIQKLVEFHQGAIFWLSDHSSDI